MWADCSILLGEDSSEAYCLIHGEPTDLEVGDVHEDGSWGLVGGVGGLPGLAPAPGRQGPRRPAFPRSAALFLGSQNHVADAAAAVRQVEQRLEALRPLEQGGRVRDLLRSPRLAIVLGASRADVRRDHRARSCLGGRRQRGQDVQALGRSRGGYSTKIHLKTDFDGHPIAFELTGGEKGNAPHFLALLELGPDGDPRAAVTEKGYASRTNRQVARSRVIIPVIPHKANEKDKPAFFAKALYRGRARNEQAVGRLKRFRRIALRCEKTKRNFATIVALAAALILLKSVHTALGVASPGARNKASKRRQAVKRQRSNCAMPASGGAHQTSGHHVRTLPLWQVPPLGPADPQTSHTR